MNKVNIIDDFLSVDECLSILDKCKTDLTLKPATIMGDVLSDKRKSSVAFVNNIEDIDLRLKFILKDLIKLKGFDVTGIGSYQFTEYKVGEYYDWHTDSSDTHEMYKNRFCSIVIQLNDDYEGGHLEVKNDSDTIQLERGSGKLCVFYSNMLHRVTPVTNGVRYSLVNWVSLKEIEGFKKTLI